MTSKKRLILSYGILALLLAELFAALQKARLEPKRMQLLSYHRTKAPYAVLVEAVKEGGPGLDILPPHYQTEARLT